MKGKIKCAIYMRVGKAEQLENNLKGDKEKEREQIQTACKTMREHLEEQSCCVYKK